VLRSNLKEDAVGVIIFGDFSKIREGDEVGVNWQNSWKFQFPIVFLGRVRECDWCSD